MGYTGYFDAYEPITIKMSFFEPVKEQMEKMTHAPILRVKEEGDHHQYAPWSYELGKTETRLSYLDPTSIVMKIKRETLEPGKCYEIEFKNQLLKSHFN